MDREKNGLNDEERTLLELFKKRFPEHKPTSAEERLLAEVETGEVIDYRSEDAADNDPGKAEEWGDERSISARAIQWLCMDLVAASRITHQGIQVRGAKVAEDLDLSFADVSSPLRLFGCAFTGSISLIQSRIKVLAITGSHTHSISADGMDVKGDVFLSDGFKAEGEVRLLGATIGGQLNCTKGQFSNPDGRALSADRMDVKGDVFLSDGFKAEGRVTLVSTVVTRCLKLTSILEPEKARFNFTATTVDTLWDEEASWPAKGNVVLDGFVYRRLQQGSPHDAKTRIRWFRLQPGDYFYPQPYEQLAKVLQESGYEEAAKRIHIAKNRDPAKLKEMSIYKRFLYRFVLGGLTGYGYRPWRALWVGIALILIGWWLFFAAGREEIMVPAQSEAVPTHTAFHALPYSIDMFVPLVDLGQADCWTPHEERSGTLFSVGSFAIPLSGLFLRVVAWVLNILGWVLTTLLVTGLAGVIRRRM